MAGIAGMIVALVLHLVLGWPFSVAGGVVAGYLAVERGWLWGGLAVGLPWALLVAYNFIVASAPVSRMIDAMAEIMGNMPEAMFVVLTILIGCALGVCGGLVGAQTARIVRSRTLLVRR
ncbi:MAG: hypothetical protein SH809_10035 [Rhodothermales bacterium]|nr:hypothetical protein [Rhodothermales bacterium]